VKHQPHSLMSLELRLRRATAGLITRLMTRVTTRVTTRVRARVALPLLCGIAASVATVATAAPPRDKLYMLVPDTSSATLNSWQVKVWLDSAADEGVQIQPISDAELLAQCTPTLNCAAAVSRYGGLILPDSAHIRASAAVVAAVKSYANLGGKLMLVYDAGALDENGFYAPTDTSRFSDLAGVDYVKYISLRDKVVGFGQVVGTKARLEDLGFAPGKYSTYVPPAGLASGSFATAFVPSGVTDPGGTKAMAEAVAARASKGIDDGTSSLRPNRPVSLRTLLGLNAEPLGPVKYGTRVTAAGRFTDLLIIDNKSKRLPEHVSAIFDKGLKKTIELALPPVTTDDLAPQTISGYGFGPLNYFHFVTLPLTPAGGYSGTPYLTSPEHGLVAGVRQAGSGQVLFVNMPLGYMKAIGTDSAPMQGFLGHFARDLVGVVTTSVQPRAVGGMIYNWHIDDGDDLLSDSKFLLDKTDSFTRGPYSLHFTAGPDVINYGDRAGINLNNDAAARDLVYRLGRIGTKWAGKKGLPVQHALGSHGGWIHDCWGAEASKVQTINEANAYLPFCGSAGTSALTLSGMLKKNFDAIENAVGFRLREYSSPVGNTPTWAVNWIETHKPDVVAMYLVADVGSAMLRSWRATPDSTAFNPLSARLSTRIWTSPVSPFGKYATWEEFSDFGIDTPTASQWLLDLQSYVVNHRTNRMYYNHPPGARSSKTPIDAILDRSERLQNLDRFKFYTMSELADFSERRVNSRWSCSGCGSGGIATFTAAHATSLEDISWMLPKATYLQPSVVSGHASISADSSTWIVTAEGGTALTFRAAQKSGTP
jgi:hypothetical protein